MAAKGKFQLKAKLKAIATKTLRHKVHQRTFGQPHYDEFPSPHNLLKQPINLLNLVGKVFNYIGTEFAKTRGG